jgi:hypothetical protein
MEANTQVRTSRFIWEAEDIVVEKHVQRMTGYQRHLAKLEGQLKVEQTKLVKARHEMQDTSSIERSIKSLQARIDLV